MTPTLRNWNDRNHPPNIAINQALPGDVFPSVALGGLKGGAASMVLKVLCNNDFAQLQRLNDLILGRLNAWGVGWSASFERTRYQMIAICVDVVDSHPEIVSRYDLTDQLTLFKVRQAMGAAVLRVQRMRRNCEGSIENTMTPNEGLAVSQPEAKPQATASQLLPERTNVDLTSPTQLKQRLQVPSPQTSLPSDKNPWEDMLIKTTLILPNHVSRTFTNLLTLFLSPTSRTDISERTANHEAFDNWSKKLDGICKQLNTRDASTARRTWCVFNGRRESDLLDWMDWTSHIARCIRDGQSQAHFDVILSDRNDPKPNDSPPPSTAPLVPLKTNLKPQSTSHKSNPRASHHRFANPNPATPLTSPPKRPHKRTSSPTTQSLCVDLQTGDSGRGHESHTQKQVGNQHYLLKPIASLADSNTSKNSKSNTTTTSTQTQARIQSPPSLPTKRPRITSPPTSTTFHVDVPVPAPAQNAIAVPVPKTETDTVTVKLEPLDSDSDPGADPDLVSGLNPHPKSHPDSGSDSDSDSNSGLAFTFKYPD